MSLYVAFDVCGNPYAVSTRPEHIACDPLRIKPYEPLGAFQVSNWDEILRLATKAAGARSIGSGMAGREARLEACAELLAEIGVIHNTPNGKRDWIEGRE